MLFAARVGACGSDVAVVGPHLDNIATIESQYMPLHSKSQGIQRDNLWHTWFAPYLGNLHLTSCDELQCFHKRFFRGPLIMT